MTMVMNLNHKKSKKDLLSLKDLDIEEINQILDRGEYWADKLNSRITSFPRTIDNPVICNLFFESSTRTRLSFEVAAKKLGYHVMNFHPSSSSTQKGETLYDTLKTLEAMGVNCAIIRTSDENVLQEVAANLNISLVNAGAGSNEHPTQGLLDLLTMREVFGKIQGLKVAIVGDIKHSRVANSNIIALTKLNAEVFIAGPAELLPDVGSDLLTPNVKILDVDEAMQKADVVMMLRLQLERHKSSQIVDDYLQKYGLNKKRFAALQEQTVIMHPAPFNREVEIDGDLVEHPRSLIYKQVANGVAVRMAVLERAL